VFEAMPMLGGMLRYGIPAYRLPRHIVDWEIDGILALGMDARLNVKLGRDFSLKELQRSGFDSIFVGIGAWSVPHLCIPGEYATGVYRSLDFLSRVGSVFSTLQNKRVVVIGESNTAMDCARLSVRLGAESVTVICPCRRKDMTARKRDVERAEQEGVRIRHATQPVRVIYDTLGCAAHLIYRRLEVIGEEGSRHVRYAPLAGTDAPLPVDLVIVAYERKPDLTCLLEGEDSELDFRISPAANLDVERDTFRAASTDIFAAGDLHTGRATVISAVAGGRLAARSIHYLLTTGKIPVPANLQRKLNPHSILKDIRLAAALARTDVAEMPVAQRCKTITAEVVPTITAAQAVTECRRCLQCGTYCYDHA
jgi:NADPH-dependent glutamate synthase beta subunit-like oxidoreductase